MPWNWTFFWMMITVVGAGAAAIFTCQYAPFSHNNNNKSNIPCMENFPRITVLFWCCTGCSRQSLSQRGTLHQQQSSLAFWDKEGKKLDLFMSHCLVFTAFVWKWRILNYCKLSVSIPLHRELLQQYIQEKSLSLLKILTLKGEIDPSSMSNCISFLALE